MVSALWKACSDGDLEKVNGLLREASHIDIELKDHTGVTPLIEAVRKRHTEVVKALLDKGADPTNASSQGRPDQYTSDSTILELLNHAQAKPAPNGVPSQDPAYTHDSNDDSDKRYYAPPPGAYPYYPTINPALSTVNEGGVYYPPPPQTVGDNSTTNGIGNLPPPEVARYIPCRYFPACRYGSSCLFAHPQTPYYQGAMPPPAQYPPYDPMAPPYAPGYYPPPPFQQPNGVHPMTPLSPPPGPHLMHARSPSEVVSPSQVPFSPNGVPPPLPYGQLPTSAYPHPGQMPAPMTISPLPPIHHQSNIPHPGPQSPNVYNPTSPPVQHYPVQQDQSTQYSQPPPSAIVNYQDIEGVAKPLPVNSTSDLFAPNHAHRDSVGHHRRGAGRRGSFGGRKPPCIFFPSGRCKNGDDCRFPHVIDNHPTSYFSSRGNGSRSRGNGNGSNNGLSTIEGKLNNMSIRDESTRQQNGEDSSRSHSTDPGSRPRYSNGPKNNHAGNTHGNKKPAAVKQQRVPNADEFPVLGGSVTPPSRSPGANGVLVNGSGHLGPTAAQVLQAPPPARKDGTIKDTSTRGVTPEKNNAGKEAVLDVNSSVPVIPVAPVQGPENVINKLPVSFAAVASPAPDISKEVSVSA